MIALATEKDYPGIIELWELSVRATHHFLHEDYLQEIKRLLPTIFPHVQIYKWQDDDSTITGFAGVAGDKMEMLFIHPRSMGQGLGRLLDEYCLHNLNADKVDVNEHNARAVKFYENIGYRQIGCRELDSKGRPFPLLEMQYFLDHSSTTTHCQVY
jgi:putative acetyltransferase